MTDRRGLPTPDFVPATRASYDTIAPEYAARHPDGTAGRPLDRALLAAFAELSRKHAPRPVADLGSGPGDVTARLHALDVPVFGVDVSPRMVEVARRAHPGLRFHVGSMTALDLPDGTLGGVLALYSIIHVPDDHLVALFEEFRRVLVVGAPVLLGFQSGDVDEVMRISERFGRGISLDFHVRGVDTVVECLAKAGLTVGARALREAEGEETRPRAFVLASKP
ncbi:class I SAM-dependent methyltransferase [Streptomyces sp. NPDC088387]|uniref:class I SAM-dependent methyltransferase n=1 Tax=Streptomyces sp. NPDC088387 TaxID=3365859 RepID=UPI003827E26A